MFPEGHRRNHQTTLFSEGGLNILQLYGRKKGQASRGQEPARNEPSYLGDRCTQRGLPELSEAWRHHQTSEPRRQKVRGEDQLQNREVENSTVVLNELQWRWYFPEHFLEGHYIL